MAIANGGYKAEGSSMPKSSVSWFTITLSIPEAASLWKLRDCPFPTERNRGF